jgi:hypothetical protein
MIRRFSDFLQHRSGETAINRRHDPDSPQFFEVGLHPRRRRPTRIIRLRRPYYG